MRYSAPNSTGWGMYRVFQVPAPIPPAGTTLSGATPKEWAFQGPYEPLSLMRKCERVGREGSRKASGVGFIRGAGVFSGFP
jgi:hypothetical protein